MTGFFRFDFERATQAINFFARMRGGKIDKLDVLKLIFLADRYHLRKFGRLITNDKYLAMNLGPVASRTKNLTELSKSYASKEELAYAERFFDVEDYKVCSKMEFDAEVLSESDLEALNYCWEKFGKGIDLVQLTHEFPEWKKFEQKLPNRSSSPIEMKIEDFLDDPENPIVDKLNELSHERREALRELLAQERELADFW